MHRAGPGQGRVLAEHATAPSDLYGDELERLADLGVAATLVDNVAGLVSGAATSRTLTPVTRELGTMLAYACRANDTEARRHGRAAIAAGLTRPAAFEALLIGLLHGGFDKLWDHLWLLREAADAQWPTSDVPDLVTDEHIEAHFGGMPEWIRLMHEWQPDVLKAYYRVRTDLFRDGALSRKDKELLLVTINAAEHYEAGLSVHVKAARQLGAREAEIMDAVLAGIPAGGVVAWFAGAELASSLARD